MNQDASADQRFELNQKILAKERRIDEASGEYRRVQEAMEAYGCVMDQGFTRMQELNEDLIARGAGDVARRRVDVGQAMQGSLRDVVRRQSEDTEAAYGAVRQYAESEIEEFQKARDGLPWD